MSDNARSLLDRYVYAIRRLLPRQQRDDIASELREILQCQVDDEENRVQRPLRDEEIRAILKHFGKPREVALRYGAQQYLIGPEVFPSYLAAVKVVLWFLVPITLFIVLIAAVTAKENLVISVLGALWIVVKIGLVNLGIVTLLFVYFGRAASGNLNADDWDLDDLPEVPSDPNAPVPRSEVIGSLVGLVLMLCWWLGLNAVLQRWFGWAPLPIVWAPVWADVTVTAISVIVACTARELMGLMRPLWTKAYRASGAVLDLLALPVLFRLLASHNLVSVADGASARGSMIGLGFLLNGSIFIGLVVMSIGVVASCVHDVWRLVRPSRVAMPTGPGSHA